MLLSQTGQYAVRAAIHLAQYAEHTEGTLRVGEIAEALDVPQNYLSKILHQLARAGVLESVRGPRGGFRLADAPEALSVMEVIDAVEPTRSDRRCLLGRAECSNADPCPAHDRWKDLAEGILSFLHDTTLADLQRRQVRVKRKRSPRRKAARA